MSLCSTFFGFFVGWGRGGWSYSSQEYGSKQQITCVVLFWQSCVPCWKPDESVVEKASISPFVHRTPSIYFHSKIYGIKINIGLRSHARTNWTSVNLVRILDARCFLNGAILRKHLIWFDLISCTISLVSFRERVFVNCNCPSAAKNFTNCFPW